MKKDLVIDKEFIKIIEHKKKFLSTEYEDKETKVPVYLIRMIQKAYSDEEGTMSVSIFLKTENEFLITYDEVDDIDSLFNELVDLKNEVETFRIELYNIKTRETFDK